MSGDVVTWLEGRLEEARAEAATAVDRAEALVELRGLVFEFTARRGTGQLSPTDLWQAPETEQERARLQALIDRAVPAQEEQT